MAMTMMMIAEYNLPEITCEFFMFQYLDAVVQYYAKMPFENLELSFVEYREYLVIHFAYPSENVDHLLSIIFKMYSVGIHVEKFCSLIAISFYYL